MIIEMQNVNTLINLKFSHENTNKVAKEVNSQFYKNESHYVTIKERLEYATKTKWDKERINFAIASFKSKYPNIVTWNDINLCEAGISKLSDILIDVTLQRLLNLNHFTDILYNFEQIKVMPIQVYVSKDKPDNKICWDGQHTLAVLYTIAVYILGLDPKDVKIPVVLYKSNLKSEMRSNFIKLNGDSKLPIDAVDFYQQTVFGVRTDNASYPEWILNEKKQKMLEKADMFATHEKFGNADQPGALSNLSEFLDNRFDPSITEAFCKYFKAVCNSNRAVDSKETWMLYMYFDLCRRQDISLTDEYIQEIADALNKSFDGNFDSESLYNQAKLSWQNYYRTKISPNNNLLGISYDKKKDTINFLIPQVAKYIKSKIVPEVMNKKWIVPVNDLF